MMGVLTNTFKPTFVQKFLRTKVHIALAVPILLHESESWILRKNDKTKLTTVEMKFFRRTAGYTLYDHKRNLVILEELKVEPVDEKLRRHK